MSELELYYHGDSMCITNGKQRAYLPRAAIPWDEMILWSFVQLACIT